MRAGCACLDSRRICNDPSGTVHMRLRMVGTCAPARRAPQQRACDGAEVAAHRAGPTIRGRPYADPSMEELAAPRLKRDGAMPYATWPWTERDGLHAWSSRSWWHSCSDSKSRRAGGEKQFSGVAGCTECRCGPAASNKGATVAHE